MAEPIHNQVLHSTHEAGALYHRLVLLVGKTGTGKTNLLQKVAAELNTSVINVNLEVSSKLLELTAKQRSIRLPEILREIAQLSQSPIILDNLEILFDKDLKQDPLRLLQGISRNQTVVASWNGTIAAGRLFYAEPGHSKYRYYDSVDALVVDVNNSTTIDSETNYQEAERA